MAFFALLISHLQSLSVSRSFSDRCPLYKLPYMANGKLDMLRSFVESLNTRDRLLIESEEEAAVDAGRAAESIASIDKSIGLVNASADALANAQDHRVKSTQSSPLAASEDKSSIESKATEAKEQIRQSADAKTAELNERKRAIETNLAVKQAEPA
jgi:hypothetical protein